MTEAAWGKAKVALQTTVGQNNYKNWISPLQLMSIGGGVAHFSVPTSFAGTWVERNFSDQLLHALADAGAGAHRLDFSVAETATATPNNTNVAPPPAARIAAAAAAAEKDQPSASLDSRFTFDSFVVGKPNQLAYSAARRVAEGGHVTFNPLFLYGGVGLGKTHLMHAIAHQLSVERPDLKVVYLSADQFMYRFVRALREDGTMEFKELFRSVDVLMVDDVQFLAGKNSTQEEFFHTFNALVDQNKQVIISADRAPTELKKIEDRIASRLQSGLVVDPHPTDYELRLGILQKKVALYKNDYQGLEIGENVLEFLAHRITSNVRVLEGALTRLYAFGSLVGKEITLDLAQDCLVDILRASDRKVTVEEIQRAVSEHYNMRLSDMIGPKRHRTIARPRQMAMYLAKQLTSRSLPEIGRRFGGRDHTTVMHAVKRIDELKLADSQLADDLQMLQRMLEA